MNKHIVKSGIAILIAATLAALVGCEKWLNVPPKGKIVAERVEEYSQMLNEDNICKHAYHQPLYLTDDVLLPTQTEATGADLQSLSGSHEAKLYTYSEEGYYNEVEGYYYYDVAYSRISTYNIVIDGVARATGDARQARSVRAEALCGRAMEYLTLINLFAPHYDAASAASSYGIPLVLTPDLEAEGHHKASVAEVYAQVESDLREALPDLPEKPTYSTALRFSRVAAQTLLAKAAFLKGEWAAALELCSDVLAARSELHDWTKQTLLDPTFLMTDMPDVVQNEENILLRFNDYKYGLSESVYGSPSLLALYDQTSDLRYVFQFADNYYGVPLTDPSLRFYSSSIAFSTGLGTPEVYLMAAECKVRTGDWQGGIELINRLRNHRIVGNTPLVVNNQAEALREVLAERRRELFNHSIDRLIDIKRLAKDPATKVVVRHELTDGSVVEVDGADERMILPIPPHVLRFNPAMKPRG